MTNVCTIASTDLYFEIYDLWMVFAKTELGDPGSALPALQLMPPCTSEKKQNLRLSIQSAAHTRNTTTTHLSAGRSFTTWQTLTPLSLFANWLYVSAQREKYLLSFFTWTTKRNVCCDKTKKIEMDLHVGHPFTINTGIILLGFIYFLTKTWTFILEVRIHRTIIPFSLYSSLNLDTGVKNMAQK